MGMINAVRRAYSNYFTLQGRATRSDYWWFLAQRQMSVAS